MKRALNPKFTCLTHDALHLGVTRRDNLIALRYASAFNNYKPFFYNFTEDVGLSMRIYGLLCCRDQVIVLASLGESQSNLVSVQLCNIQFRLQ